MKIREIVFFLLVANTSITSLIGAASNPGLTETQRFLAIPQFFIWDFEVK